VPLVDDLPEEWLVDEELVLLHLLALLAFAVCLSDEEISVLLVDALYLVVEPVLLGLVVLQILLPHDGLFIVERSLHPLPVLLLLDLAGEEAPHLLLLTLHRHHAPLVLHAVAHLLFEFVLADLVVFISLPIVHLLDHSASHPVHEVLGALLPGGKLVCTVLLLLFKHASVLLLRSNILLTLALTHLFLLGLLTLVLDQHLLQVLLLLSLLLNHHCALLLHFGLEPVNHFRFLCSLVFLIVPLAMLLLL